MKNKILDKATSFFNFPQIDSNVTVWLNVDGKEYEVDQFKIGFSQPTDDKGKPQSEIKGGQLMVTLSETVPDTIYDWAIKPNREKDGRVIFKIDTGSAPLRVEFFRAACINFNRNVSSSGGLQTNLILSPDRLMINGVEYNNFWIE